MPRKSIRNGNLGEKIGGKRTALEVLWADEDTRWGEVAEFCYWRLRVRSFHVAIAKRGSIFRRKPVFSVNFFLLAPMRCGSGKENCRGPVPHVVLFLLSPKAASENKLG